MFITMEPETPDHNKFEKRESLRSGKKRVLFPTDSPCVDDLSDLRLLSSPENNSISSPEHSLTDEDIFESLCISPTIHKGIENLLMPESTIDHKKHIVSINSTDCGQDGKTGIIVPSSDQKHRSEESITLTPWNEKPYYNSPQITPGISVTVDCLDAPLKIAAETNNIISEGSGEKCVFDDKTSLKPSLFYGSNRPTLDLVRKIRLNRLLADHSRVKAKLFKDENLTRNKKYARSRSTDSLQSVKKTTGKKQTPMLFSGVGHGIRKLKPKKSIKKNVKRLTFNGGATTNIRDIITKKFDFSRTPYGVMKSECKWNYHLAHTKSERISLDKSGSKNRKFFKTSVSFQQTKKRKDIEEEDLATTKKLKYEKKCTDIPVSNDTTDLIELLNEQDTEMDQKLETHVSNIINTLEDEGDPMLPSITKYEAENASDSQQLTYLLPSNNSDLLSQEIAIDNVASPSGVGSYYGTMFVNQDNNMKENSLDGNMKENSLDDNMKENSPVNVAKSENKSPAKSPFYSLFKRHSYSNASSTSVLKDVTNKKTRNSLKKAAADINQRQIDAGQKKFGATECKVCHMVYHVADPLDEQRHNDFHNSTDVFRYKSWKLENVVGFCGPDRIILVTSCDSKSHIQKVMSVLKYTENEIGSCSVFSSSWNAFLYISSDSILGCLIAEPLTQAYRVSKNDGIMLHFEQPHNVKCGINRIWTKLGCRKRGIATSLVNCLRKNYIFGTILTIDDIAFSATTNDGHAFARTYTRREDYLIYSGTSTQKILTQ